MSTSYEQDFVKGADGVFVFWPREENGAYAAHLLREIAARLDELKAELAGYRDEACRESCHDKASADGGWANI